MPDHDLCQFYMSDRRLKGKKRLFFSAFNGLVAVFYLVLRKQTLSKSAQTSREGTRRGAKELFMRRIRNFYLRATSGGVAAGLALIYEMIFYGIACDVSPASSTLRTLAVTSIHSTLK